MGKNLLCLTALLSVLVFNIPTSSAAISYSTSQAVQPPAAIAESCKCVAFRLDDIQDYFLTNAQMEIINTFEQKDVNLTIGVIGNSFGEDLLTLIFIKDKISRFNDGNSSFFIEVANHGWNHEDFTQFNEEKQSALIRQTNDKITNLVGIRPVVFIPPYNALNNNTIAALLANDIHYVSGNATFYPPSIIHGQRNGNDSLVTPAFNATNILHFASSASTGDLNTDNTEWMGYSHDSTFTAINASMSELGYAVVTMHPMEFSLRNGTSYQNKVDYDQIRELGMLIDDIRSAGFKIVTVSEIDEDRIAVVPEFAAYSTYAIFAISIGLVVWVSLKYLNEFSNHRHVPI